ncbi:MAG: MFS transporter [Sphingomonadaceae bacterium]
MTAFQGLLRKATPGSTLGPFRFQAFREIWIANLTSNMGSMIQSVAAAWLMTELTRSHTLVALVQASVTLPIMLFGLLAGAIADRNDRRKVMLVAQFAMLVASTLLAGLAWINQISPGILLVLTLSIGIGTALNSPAWQASVRYQVDKEDLPQAIALNSISFNIARSIGPAIGGALISLFNIALAFTVNAVSYLAMIIALRRWDPIFAPRQQGGTMMQAIWRGLSHCLHTAVLLRIILRGFSIGLGMAAYQALIPVLAREQYAGTASDFGILLGAFGIGSILTALIVRKTLKLWGPETVVTIGTVIIALSTLGLAFARTIFEAMPLAFAAGTGWTATMTSLNVAMQLRSPDDILGRCMATFQATTFGGMAIGAWLWGAISDAFSLSLSLEAAAAWMLASLVFARMFGPMPERGEGHVKS